MAAAADDGVEREAVSPLLPIVFSSFLCIQNEVHILKEKEEKDEGTISCKSRFPDQTEGSLPTGDVKRGPGGVSGREDA